MPSVVNLKAQGLQLEQNQLEVEPGFMSEASNVIIRRDSVVEPRRGYKIYGDSLGSSSDRAKQLFTYKERILRHYSNKIDFDNGSGTFTQFAGNYLEPVTGRKIRSIEANSNFYFTSDGGVKKISALDASQFTSASGYITQAGGVKALDVDARINYTPGSSSGFLPQDSAVAYRVVWGIKDANQNLILGTPSQRAEVYNPLLDLMIRDFDNVLLALDEVSTNTSASLINDGDYVSTLNLQINASPQELRTNLISLASKIDADILYASTTSSAPLGLGGGSSISVSTNVATITFDSGDATDYFVSGSRINLTNFSGGASVVNGPQTVASVTSSTVTFNITTADFSQSPVTTGDITSYEYESITQPSAPGTPTTDAELVAIQTYLEEIITRLQSEPTTGSAPVINSTVKTEYIDPLDITTSATVILRFTVPSEVTTSHFYQIYRSDIAIATGVAVLSTDVFPNDEMKLVFEGTPTSAQISAREITVEDIAPDEFRGANLYTNPTTGEGILQANDIPPFCTDINYFKNVTFYANTRTRHRESMNLLGVVNMLNDYGSGSNVNTFNSGDVDTSTDTISITSHGYTSGQSVIFSNSTPSDLPGGLTQGITYYILNPTTNDFQISLTVDGSPVDLTSGGSGTHTVQNQLPKFMISDGVTTNTYSFIAGVQQITEIQCNAASTLVGTANPSSYFLLNSGNDTNQYYVWYKVDSTSLDPKITGKTGIEVDVLSGDTADDVALKTANTLLSYPADFFADASTDKVDITNITAGYTTAASDGNTGFTFSVIQQGKGENASNKEILLSSLVSPAAAVDQTARSLVRVINENASEIVNAFYLSNVNEVPGQILFEKRTLDNEPFYLLGENEITGQSFNPDISPDINIQSIAVGNPTIITTSSPHGLTNLDEIIISGSDSTPSIDGLYVVNVLSSTTFSIEVIVTVPGIQGALIKTSLAGAVSDNESRKNRIYYSKLQQPEAVPILNNLDVGAKDKAILRIFPLRDSLFVFKEDGLFRISGEVAPFNIALFDSSAVTVAADSVAVSNNIIYAWTTQGIVGVTESGVRIISRPIDIAILPLNTPQYTNFKTATWGIGYESDNSYTVYTVNNISDQYATIGYRYGTLTGTWTTFDKTATAGIINPVDDRQYLGAGDINNIEQERKNFNRTDYSDREYVIQLTLNNYLGDELRFTSLENIEIGDVLVQTQYISVYDYNQLLQKLDIDPTLSPHDYLSTLELSAGTNTRNALDALLEKIANDPGRNSVSGALSPTVYEAYESVSSSLTISDISVGNPTIITTSTNHNLQTGRVITITGSDSSPSVNGVHQITVLSANTFSIPTSVITAGTTGSVSVNNDDFLDIQASYNAMIGSLNSDAGVGFSNYKKVESTTSQEAIILDINKQTKVVTLSQTLPFIVGPITNFKTIETNVTYTPITFGDPLSLKQIYEATLMFDKKIFNGASLSFSSDLIPKAVTVDFSGNSAGIFGLYGQFGTGFFGKVSSAAPFRTIVPRVMQRCRFLVCNFRHKAARESYALYGITLTGRTGISSRAYRE
jgi:hypothetical protein